MGVLDGQVALVTGCARMTGIGRAVSLALAEAGADVAVSDIAASGSRNLLEDDGDEIRASWRGLPDVVAEISALGRRAVSLIGDVGISADVKRIVTATISEFGRLDILVNNAAAPHGGDRRWTWEVPEEAFDLVMRVNAKGVFLMSSAAARHMLARGAAGRIVNISSDAGRVGLPKRAAYCSSKFAIVGLTQVLAAELAEHGITVNAVCPGGIDTPRYSSTSARIRANQDATYGMGAPPAGRIGSAQDVAAAVLYLASPAASFVTGQSLSVNGGALMG